MQKITLTLPDGSLVQELEIIPFQKLPEVICWGLRHFYLQEPVDLSAPVYAEVFCYHVPPPLPDHVYARPDECIFKFCPNQRPDRENPCEALGKCQQPR